MISMLGNVRTFLVVLLSTLPCFGQQIEVGVKGGVPITDAFETGEEFHLDFGEGATSATRRYTVGPVIEVRLPHGIGVELDVLYKRLGFDDLTKRAGVALTYTRTVANSCEFPILGKFRLPHATILHPYVEAGPSFRSLSGVSASITTTYPGSSSNSTSSTDSHLNNRSPYGIAAGAGLEFHVGRFHVSPEIRYTRWRSDNMLDPELYSNPNQVEVLVGITL
jgi:hypothetical protein